ncbi:hypothetical protein Aduo_019732 [Ancylostoma duodenale]
MERLSPNLWIPGYKKISVEDGLIKSVTYCGDNKKVTISCTCQPSVNYCEWFHEGKLVVAQQDKHSLGVTECKDFYESALVISDPKVEDCGNYMCIMNARNTTDVIDFHLYIKGLECFPAPTIYDVEKPSMDEKSGTLTLNFSVHCIEAPESVIWKRRDSSAAIILLGQLTGSEWMKISGRYDFTVRKESDYVYVLKMEIKGAGLRDEGCYSCEVANKSGEVKQKFFARLNQGEQRPFFVDHPNVDRIFYNDEDFIINVVVKVASTDRPTVQWTNPSKKVISNSSKYMQSIFSYDRAGYLAELVLMSSFPVLADLGDEEITFIRSCNIPERVRLRNRVFLSFKVMFVCQQPNFEVTWMRYLGQQKIYLHENDSGSCMIRLRKMTNQAFKAELLYEVDARKSAICFPNHGSDEMNTLHAAANSVDEPMPSTSQESPFKDSRREAEPYPGKSPKHRRGYVQRSRSSIHSNSATQTVNRRFDPSFKVKKLSAIRNMKPPH